MNKHTTVDRTFEKYKGEIWETPESTNMCVHSTPSYVFSSTMTDSNTFAKFQAILYDFGNFQKFSQMQESVN